MAKVTLEKVSKFYGNVDFTLNLKVWLPKRPKKQMNIKQLVID